MLIFDEKIVEVVLCRRECHDGKHSDTDSGHPLPDVQGISDAVNRSEHVECKHYEIE